MISMPDCAGRRVLAALVITVLVGCGGDDSSTPAEDSGPDSVVKDSSTGDTSIVDASKDSNVADTSVADGSVSDASDAAIADASDADPPNDGGAPDASIVCSPGNGFGYASVDGGCGTGEQYACNADKYELLCECPAASCTCTKNGAKVGSVAFAGCPGCKMPNFATVASGCGVPY